MCLLDALCIESPPAALGCLWCFPGGASFFELLFVDEEVDSSLVHVKFHEVTVSYMGQWTTDCGFRRAMDKSGSNG